MRAWKKRLRKNLLGCFICLLISVITVVPITKSPEIEILSTFVDTDKRGNIIKSDCHVLVKFVWNNSRIQYAEKLILERLHDAGTERRNMIIYLYRTREDWKEGKYFKEICYQAEGIDNVCYFNKYEWPDKNIRRRPEVDCLPFLHCLYLISKDSQSVHSFVVGLDSCVPTLMLFSVQ